MRKACALAVVYLAFADVTAMAGRSSFGWLTTTDVLPDRSVELESRLTDETTKDRSTSVPHRSG